MYFGNLVPLTPATSRPSRRGWRWPLPALAAWGAAWGVFAMLQAAGAAPWLAFAAGTAVGAAGGAVFGSTRTRRLVVAGGFPLSLLAAAGPQLPGWAWLVPLALLAALYPRGAWRDAPLFPTPARALDGLARLAPLPPGARVLDAGCGLGQGLAALRRAYPAARLEGIEWSPLLALATRLTRRTAHVMRGDMWVASWRGYDLVYLFQRPESMARAMAKARAELAPGAWLVSLEFEVEGAPPHAALRAPDGRPVWLYRIPCA